MDGLMLAAAILGDRKAYEEIKRIGIEVGSLPEAAAVVIRAADEQYRRDADLRAVDRGVLRQQILRKFGEGDVTDSIMDFVAQFPSDVSAINIAEEWRLLRLAQTSSTLASLLATGQHGAATDEVLARYVSLCAETEVEAEKPRLTWEDFTEKGGERIALSPAGLNDYLNGGCLRGHNIVVYGRPDSGKSMFALNASANLLRHGHKVLYVANEEPPQDLTKRLLSNLCRVDIDKLHNLDNLKKALDHAAKPYENWHLLHKAGCTIKDISRLANKIKPDMIVVDQLKNIAVDEDNRALQLDRLARQVRELGIELSAVTMSVTQAGESASGNLVLKMSDVEWSNTGIPGAADLMIGIGVNDGYDMDGKRMISLPKNKVSGKHGAFPVWVNVKQSRFMSERGT